MIRAVITFMVVGNAIYNEPIRLCYRHWWLISKFVARTQQENFESPSGAGGGMHMEPSSPHFPPHVSNWWTLIVPLGVHKADLCIIWQSLNHWISFFLFCKWIMRRERRDFPPNAWRAPRQNLSKTKSLRQNPPVKTSRDKLLSHQNLTPTKFLRQNLYRPNLTPTIPSSAKSFLTRKDEMENFNNIVVTYLYIMNK